MFINRVTTQRLIIFYDRLFWKFKIKKTQNFNLGDNILANLRPNLKKLSSGLNISRYSNFGGFT